MYIWLFWRSDGAGSATRRKTRGLTRSVSARMVPPLPAVSRPSKRIITRRPLCFTHSCSLHSSVCSLRSSFAYSLLPSFSPFLFFDLFFRFAMRSPRWHSCPALADGGALDCSDIGPLAFELNPRERFAVASRARARDRRVQPRTG